MSARGFIGSGDLYIERIVNGVSQGLQGPFEAGKFEIKPAIDRKELVSKGRNTRGQVIESVSIQKPSTFSVELREVNKDSMSIALLGTNIATSQQAAAAADYTVVAALDKWVEIGKQSLTGTITVKPAAGATPYVEGKDYVLNKTLGWIKALSTGTIADTDSLKVNAAAAAISGFKISGGTQPDIRARMVLDGVNLADSQPCIVTIHEAIVAADAAFDFLADDFAKVSLPGTLKTPTGKSEPFTVELRTTA